MDIGGIVKFIIGALVSSIVIGALFPTILTQFVSVTGANGITAIFAVIPVIIAAIFIWKLAATAFGRDNSSSDSPSVSDRLTRLNPFRRE